MSTNFTFSYFSFNYSYYFCVFISRGSLLSLIPGISNHIAIFLFVNATLVYHVFQPLFVLPSTSIGFIAPCLALIFEKVPDLRELDRNALL